MAILKANSRVPIEVEGDIYALIACAECGSKRLSECLEDFDLFDIEDLSAYIIETSRRGCEQKIRELPEGVLPKQYACRRLRYACRSCGEPGYRRRMH